MLSYFDESGLARAHAQAARKRVVKTFSLDRMVDRYQRLYSELLHVNRAAAPFADSVAKPRP
jgi:hypothetical protein